MRIAIDSTPANETPKDTLQQEGLFLHQDEMKFVLDKRLPSTNGRIRLEIIQVLNELVLRSDQLYTALYEHRPAKARPEAKSDMTDEQVRGAQSKFEHAERFFKLALDDFDKLNNSVNVRIAAYRRRLPIFRERIEASLDVSIRK